MARTHESDELAGEVGALVMQVVNEINDGWADVLAKSALTATQVKLLRHLLSRGPDSMTGIAQFLRCDPSLATGTVDKLEKHTLVRRVAQEGDRRVRLVELTEAGADLVRKVWADMRAITPVGRLDDDQLLELKRLLLAMGITPPT